MSYDLILRHARVLDASQGLDVVADLAVAAGRIAAVGPGIEASPECPERDLRDPICTVTRQLAQPTSGALDPAPAHSWFR